MKANMFSPASAWAGDFLLGSPRQTPSPRRRLGAHRGDLAVLLICFLSLSPSQEGQITSPIAHSGQDAV